jgi:inhibitor of KinA
MNQYAPKRILSASDSSVIAIFSDEASFDAHRQVLQLFRSLRAVNDPRIRNIHPAYASVLIDFDPLQITHEEVAALVEQLARRAGKEPAGITKTVCIPVCYDAQLGPDLEGVAAHCGISAEEVIRMHSSADYRVSFLGFSPGFGYLAGLPAQLAVPRLASPRILVHAGSVGIAGTQTGVYPLDSPGGWQIIGRTPQRMFDPEAQPPALLQPGDRVRFVPIHIREFESQLENRRDR